MNTNTNEPKIDVLAPPPVKVPVARLGIAVVVYEAEFDVAQVLPEAVLAEPAPTTDSFLRSAA